MCVKEDTAMTKLEKVSEEIMRFMRGKYALDEVAGKYYELDCLKFRQGKKTILSINILPDRYDFQIIFGRAEREKFDARRDEFPQWIREIYDNSHTYRDGKWMMFPVADLEALEAVKPLIFIKKKPNRKPFSKTNMHMGNCGHRCDLCIHYTGETRFTDEEKATRLKCHIAVYGGHNWTATCGGCHFPDCTLKSAKCRKSKGRDKCWDCENFNTCLKTAGYPPKIHTRNITADEVTWAILPYVKGQYGN
jgi:hypothetical protein